MVISQSQQARERRILFALKFGDIFPLQEKARASRHCRICKKRQMRTMADLYQNIQRAIIQRVQDLSTAVVLLVIMMTNE